MRPAKASTMDDVELLRASKAWPVVEATKLLERIEKAPPEKGFVLLETGYGPSGLPHIGTFAEVFRTSLVRQAFARMSDLPTQLFAFSDDMDGLRAVPDNIPNPVMVAQHLQRPLTSIPDPFGTAESYGAHMNQRLRTFLDGLGFDYTFMSATECYRSGRFNQMLLRLLERHEAIRKVVVPSLGPERRETYSPILPICPETGRVLQVPLIATDPGAGTITYRNEAGQVVEQPVVDGQAKLQWRADWAMRWAALGVDYEMYGKDLIDSVRISSQICRILGAVPPEGFSYELFLDDHGQKISKSKGNGLTVGEWLTYGTKESLKLFMFQAPRKAKRLHFDVIPRDGEPSAVSRFQTASSRQPGVRFVRVGSGHT
jgi:lysyl-tRNA synthetase class 1